MTTLDGAANLPDITDTSEKLSDLLFVVANAIARAGGETKEIESCVNIAWEMSNFISRDLVAISVAANTPLNSTCDAVLILGDRILLARENLGLTEADLARSLNTYSDHITDWECGITEPAASMIIPLANALKCDPMWLLTGEPVAIARES